MLGYIIINNTINSKDYGVYLTDANIYNKPERQVETISVAGRNGDLIMDDHKYGNLNIEFPCVIPNRFSNNYEGFVNELSQFSNTYVKIEDSFNSDTYVMARFLGINPIKVKANDGDTGTFSIKFDRKPQKYIKDGDNEINVVGNINLFNKYINEAKPLIRAYGTGTITVNDVSVQVITSDVYTDIDCELEEAYRGTANCNSNIILSSGNFPTLERGENIISATGFLKVTIKPRWWIL